MRGNRRLAAHLRLGSGLAVLALLSACGGGGGSGGGGSVISTPAPAPSPTPSPVPTPTPTPTPPPTNFSTPELERSDGPEFHGAVTAWTQGITGTGAKIAVIDTGIDIDSPEFAGRIDPASADIAGSRGVNAEDDHGTNVAMIAAAARDNTGIVGIAFGATILAFRTDEPGSCATGNANDGSLDGCAFFDRDIATGVDRAVSNGAAVINLSLGGGTPSRVLTDAVRRAAAAGIVIVVSAGNDGDSSDSAVDPNQPDPFATGLLNAGGSNVIIVGSVSDTGAFSAFSNRAGNDAASFLSARGERICCIYDNGVLDVTTQANGRQVVTVISGTSFAAPQVAGAVALLKQAFPNLTGAQITQILLTTAREAGAAGTDSIFGRGILDIGNALAPQGTTRLAGSDTALALTEATGTGSAAMGDALGGQSINAIVTDKYQRAYTYNLGAGLGGASLQPRLRNAVETSGRHVALGSDKISLAFTISNKPTLGDRRESALDQSIARELRLSPADAQMARVLAARVAVRLSPDTQFAFALSQGSSGLVAQMQGQARPAFLIASNAAGENGFLRSTDTSMALRQQVGEWGLTVSAESGEAWLGQTDNANILDARLNRRQPVRVFGAAADRRFGQVEAALGLSWMSEGNTVLGAWLHDAIGGSGSDTLFADARIGFGFAQRWRLGGEFRQGFTRARQSGFVGNGSTFASDAWSIDMTRSDTLTAGDTLGLRVSQPLRVSGGGLNLDLPVSYDYVTESAILGVRRVSLSPDGREVMGELAWRGALWNGQGALSLFYREDPGHYATTPDDKGVAISWSRAF